MAKKIFKNHPYKPVVGLLAALIFIVAFCIGYGYGKNTNETSLKSGEESIVVDKTSSCPKQMPFQKFNLPSGNNIIYLIGPMWSPNCEWIAWSVDSLEYSQDGIFIYTVKTEKVQKVPNPKNLGGYYLTGWYDDHSVSYLAGGGENRGSEIFDLLTNQ